ncbi:MAG: hypothetical protein ACREA0_19610 [bacterium]
MAKAVLKNVRLFAGAIDLTGVGNKIDWANEVDEKETTTFGSYDATSQKVWYECIGGLGKAKIAASGHTDFGAGLVDEVLWNAKGTIGPWSAYPDAASEGSLAYLANAHQGNIAAFGQVGDVAPWSANWSSSSAVARGVGLHNPATARTATGNGTGVQHVAVASGKTLYAGLHVLSASGTTPSVTVKVQSSVDNTFAAPTDRITFTAATAATSEFKSLAGPITDTWYRVVFTISGTTPSFLFLTTLGIGAL